MIAIEFFILLLLLLANGVFAMTEMAVVSARKGRLRQLALGGNHGAALALQLATAPNRFLPAVQLGITLVGLLAGAFGGATLAEQLAAHLAQIHFLAPYAEALGVGAVVVGLTFFSLLIGELVPKRLALAQPERIASLMARPLEWLSQIARPLVWGLGRATDLVLTMIHVKPQPADQVSEDEVKLLMQEGTQAGVFHPDEPRMVESVLSFDQRPVTDIMTPRNKVTFLRADETPERLWHKVVVSGHSNYPVHEGRRDHVIGVVAVKAIYANQAVGVSTNVADLMIRPLFVPATQTIAALLESFRHTGQHLGIVIDAQERFLGLVTLVDVLEAIVGEIPAQDERLKPEARPRGDGSWLVDGQFDSKRLWRLLQVEAEPDRITPKQTVAALLALALAGNIVEGAVALLNGWEFEILDLDGERIDKILVQRRKELP